MSSSVSSSCVFWHLASMQCRYILKIVDKGRVPRQGLYMTRVRGLGGHGISIVGVCLTVCGYGTA